MHSKSTNGTKPTVTRLVCAVCFVLFAFSWLYWFQADMLAVAQHGLSGGVTHYDRSVGAVIITSVLLVLQLIVYAFTRLARRTHALTYFPSMLMLAFISSASYPFVWGAWLWAGPLVLALWAGVVWLARKMLPFDNDAKLPVGFFSRRMWLNLLQMAAMMLMVAAVSDSNAVSHFRAHAEVMLLEGKPEKVLETGARSQETDESLTMMRIFALSQQGELGNRLFEYPVAGGSQDMLPLLGSKSRLQLVSDTLLWDYFGARPDSLVLHADSLGYESDIYGGRLMTRQYLNMAERDTLARQEAIRDYRLMGYLIDRQIDSFAVRLPQYYTLSPDSLPRHYREALVLYRQLRDTLYIYSDSLMAIRWHEFCRYDTLYPRKTEKLLRMEQEQRSSYWYYFFR